MDDLAVLSCSPGPASSRDTWGGPDHSVPLRKEELIAGRSPPARLGRRFGIWLSELAKIEIRGKRHCYLRTLIPMKLLLMSKIHGLLKTILRGAAQLRVTNARLTCSLSRVCVRARVCACVFYCVKIHVM